MLDKSKCNQLSKETPSNGAKRLGHYLVEAGLLTPDQVSVALNDQKATGMRFGDIVVARGWLKEQTIEWIMQKVVIPEKRASQRERRPSPQSASPPISGKPVLENESTACTQNGISGTAIAPQGLIIITDKGAPFASCSDLVARGDFKPPNVNTKGHSGMAHSTSEEENSSKHRQLPMSKPLPHLHSTDTDVNWVG
jgi:hypothetical protein